MVTANKKEAFVIQAAAKWETPYKFEYSVTTVIQQEIWIAEILNIKILEMYE